MAVLVLGQHHGHPSVPSRTDSRADAPVVGMHDFKLAVSQQSRDCAPKPRVHDRHRMRPRRVGVETGQPLGSRPDVVQRDSPVESRFSRTIRGDGDDFDVMATVHQGVRQVSNMMLLPTRDRGIELRHH
jgi:hypothetical protein